jgi:hypothetical protein
VHAAVVCVDAEDAADRAVGPRRAGQLLRKLGVGEFRQQGQRLGAGTFAQGDDLAERLRPTGFGSPRRWRRTMLTKFFSMPARCARWSFALQVALGSCSLFVAARVRSASGRCAKVSRSHARSLLSLISTSVRFISWFRGDW